jgi:hypothetical protein
VSEKPHALTAQFDVIDKQAMPAKSKELLKSLITVNYIDGFLAGFSAGRAATDETSQIPGQEALF